MEWLRAVERLRSSRQPGALLTIASVRGHAPRSAGAKMVVAADAAWGTIGGGNLEAVAVERARAALAARSPSPELWTVALSDRAPYEHGVQCCGGEVTVLLEPLAVVPAVAVFGVGHVGIEIARVLARLDVDLHLVDSRPGQLTAQRLASLDDAVARVRTHEVPVLPELVLSDLPVGTDVLILTHDHAEDAALCDAALRTPGLRSIGLIGSAGKWARFRRTLLDEGHDESALSRISTPIGLPEVADEHPAAIAVGVVAALLASWQRQAVQSAAER